MVHTLIYRNVLEGKMGRGGGGLLKVAYRVHL